MVLIMEKPVCFGVNIGKAAVQTGKTRYRQPAALGKRGVTKPLLNKRKKAQLEKWR